MDKARHYTTQVKKHHVIIVPGLGNRYWFFQWATRDWREKGLTVHFVPMAWEKGKKLGPKLDKLTQKIDTLARSGNVSLIGASAGASAVINAFSKRKKKVYKVINICGRLREGTHVFPPLALAALSSAAFKESVLRSERILPTFTKQERKRILTIRPLFDEIVPGSTVPIPGVLNRRIIAIGHTISIALAITFFAKHILSFLVLKR